MLSDREQFLKDGMSARQRAFNQQTIRDVFAIGGTWPLDLGEIIQPLREQLQDAQIVRQPSEPIPKPRAPSLKLAIRILYTRAKQRASRCPAQEERKASHAPVAVDIEYHLRSWEIALHVQCDVQLMQIK